MTAKDFRVCKMGQIKRAKVQHIDAKMMNTEKAKSSCEKLRMLECVSFSLLHAYS